MLSVSLEAPGNFEIKETDRPRVKNPHDVLLKVSAVGVCGSDIHYYSSGKIGDQVVQYPWIIGHECSAFVEVIGADVIRVQPGDLVAVDPLIVCGRCDRCQADRRNTCREQRFLGCPGQMQGCMSEYIVMPEECCFKVPDALGPVEAMLVEPLSIGVYTIALLQAPEAENGAILGSGPIGLSVLAAARKAGVQQLFATDKLDYRVEAARTFGAEQAANPDKTDVVGDFSRMMPAGFDFVADCSGDQEALDQAIELLRPGGTLLIAGIPEDDRVSFDISRLRRKEITIKNVRRQNECIPGAIELIASGAVDVDTMVTHFFEPADSGKAFDIVTHYREKVIKSVIQF